MDRIPFPWCQRARWKWEWEKVVTCVRGEVDWNWGIWCLGIYCISRTGFRVGKWDECSGKWYVSFLGGVCRMLLLSPGESDIDFHRSATLCKNLVSPCRDHSLNKYASFPFNEICWRSKAGVWLCCQEYYGTLDITCASPFLFWAMAWPRREARKPASKHLGARHWTGRKGNNQAYAGITWRAGMNTNEVSHPIGNGDRPQANNFSNLAKNDVKI